MSKLKENIQYYWYCFKLWLPINKLKILYWDIYRTIKFGFQRMFRGFSNQDGYCFYFNFVNRHIKLLKHFKKYNIGYPCNITAEEWDKILDEMIYHLELMNEDRVVEKLCEGMPEDYYPCYTEVGKIMERHKDEFFKLFSKWFYDLWF